MTSISTSPDAILNLSPQAAQKAQGLSLRTFLASLVTLVSLFAIKLIIFIFLRNRIKQIYQPRTFLIPEDQRTKELPSGLISWVPPLFRIPESTVLRNSGLDAFFYLRYIRTLLKIFILPSICVLPSLLPLNFLGGGDATGALQGLDRFSWANIRHDRTSFYWAHLVMALVSIFWTCCIIYVELVFYIEVRNIYLTSPDHRRLISANTILITDIPRKYLLKLDDVYSIFPAGVRKVWINRDLSALSKQIEKRMKLVSALETTATKLIRSVTRSSGGPRNGNAVILEKEDISKYMAEYSHDHMYPSPTNWTWIPWISYIKGSSKTILYYINELSQLNRTIEASRKQLEDVRSGRVESTCYPLTKSAFIQFNTQSAAYMAYQTILHSNNLSLSARHIGTSGRDIRWDTLSQGWSSRYARSALVWTTILLLLMLWAIPIAFTGFLSQLTSFADRVSWLRWINSAPSWLSGFVQGVLPQLILTVLNILLPQILRIIIRWQGLVTESATELWLQNYYFIFLFVQNFLTVSLSSSITGIVQDINRGLQSLPALLARNIPKASNYFFSYLTLQGLVLSAGALLQAGALTEQFALAPLMDRTPREKWKRQKNLSNVQWGTVFPTYTTLACIGLIYSIISPFILVFSVVIFGLFWVVSRYNLFFVSISTIDTSGKLYPTALKQLFAGIYIMELCLIGLFLSIRDDTGRLTGIAQASIMMIATAATLLYQLFLSKAFDRALECLPLSADITRGEEKHSGLKHSSTSAFSSVRTYCSKVLHFKEVSSDLRECIHELARSQFITLNREGYEQENALYSDPTIWIPKDCLGLSDEIIQEARLTSDIRFTNEYAVMHADGKVTQSRIITDKLD